MREEADRFADLFEPVVEIWKGRGNEEAVGFTHMTKESAQVAREALMKREQGALDVAIETTAASCESCHRDSLEMYEVTKC